jgi:hypothetical protein
MKLQQTIVAAKKGLPQTGLWQRIGLSFCSAGLPPQLRKTCGTFVTSTRIRGSPHKPRSPRYKLKNVNQRFVEFFASS